MVLLVLVSISSWTVEVLGKEQRLSLAEEEERRTWLKVSSREKESKEVGSRLPRHRS